MSFDPRMVVFGESGVEDLMGRLDAPAAAHDGEPVLLAEAASGKLETEVAIVAADELAVL
jgi:hypothetical protein